MAEIVLTKDHVNVNHPSSALCCCPAMPETEKAQSFQSHSHTCRKSERLVPELTSRSGWDLVQNTVALSVCGVMMKSVVSDLVS